MKVWLNGTLVDEQDAKISVLDHGTLYGDGVFEGIREYGGKVFQIHAHVDRLFASAENIRLAIPYSKEDICRAIRQTLEANAIVDGYIRLVVTRGYGTLGLNPFKCTAPNVFIIVTDQIVLYTQEMYDNGLAVIIAKTVRTSPNMLDPSIKSLNYLNNIMARIEAADAGVEEAVMLNADGNVAECTGDNIFIVTGGQVTTPPVSAGVLVGVTRSVVMRLAGQIDIPTAEADIIPDDIYQADECFLTGTAAEIIAVTKVDGHTIGTGRPGPVTARLQQAFRDYIAAGDFE